VSLAGSVYARLVLGIDVRDLTGGFKCFRRVVLETIDMDSISSLGYTFQVETTYRALRAGFRVEEVPIVFSDREVGGSKMTKRIVAEAVWRIPVLRFAAMRSRL
jgi:dolichol-phosphate mannosyltransferase